MTPIRRLGGWAFRFGCLVPVFLTAQPPNRLSAQDSQFGIRGLGTPGKWESVRARTTGGAFAPFDAFSPMADAALADVRRMSASMASGTSWRSTDASGSTAALRATPIPALVIAGPVTSRIIVGGGFGTYLDRTFGIIVHDTIDLRGQPQAVTDQITNDGAVSDVRLAVAARLGNRLALGLGLHRLTGSSRIVATRTFADTVNYRTSTARDEVAYGGTGGSASLLFDVTRDIRLGGWFRSDSKLRANIGGVTKAENDLPVTYGTRGPLHTGGEGTLPGTVTWGSWSSAGDSTAHDTFNWSVGAKIGRPSAPFPFGVPGADMPFGYGKAPSEV